MSQLTDAASGRIKDLPYRAQQFSVSNSFLARNKILLADRSVELWANVADALETTGWNRYVSAIRGRYDVACLVNLFQDAGNLEFASAQA